MTMNVYRNLQDKTEYSIPKIIWFIICILITSFTAIWICWVVYFRMKHSFWSIQPVFHLHHIHKWFYTPHKVWDLYPRTKYVNDYNVMVVNLNELLKKDKNEYLQLMNEYSHFIKSYYVVHNQHTYYYPTSDSLHLYLNNNSNPSYIGYYQVPMYKHITDKSLEKGIFIHEKKSMIAFRNISLYIKGVNKDGYQNNSYVSPLEMYYVDYLCTDVSSRKHGITPKLIYTSARSIANSHDTTINTFLFKREGVVHGIVPFIQYKSYLFNMTHWKTRDKSDIKPLQYTEVTSENFSLFIHSLELIKREIHYMFLSKITNLKGLIEEKKIIPFILHHRSEIYGLYIFKNAEYTYKQNTTLEFISAWFNFQSNDYDINLFFDVFLDITKKIRMKYQYTYIIIENVSHIQYLFKHIYGLYRPEYSYTSSYYLYNYIHPTVQSKDTFLLF
jgi:hypothetical protein